MSKQAKPPPPGDKAAPSAPPPPPAWRNWLWPIMIVVIFALWYLPAPRYALDQPHLLPVPVRRVRAPGEDGAARQHVGRHEHRHADQREELHRGHPAAGGPGPADRPAAATACRSPPLPSGNGFGTTVLIYLITFGLPIVFFIWFFRRISKGAASGLQGALGVGRSRAKVFDEEQPSTTFADVAGYEGAKAEIAEVVDFLKQPGPVHQGRRDGAPRRADGRPARHRQDAAGPRGRGRGARAVLLGHRVQLRRAVRRRRRVPGP